MKALNHAIVTAIGTALVIATALPAFASQPILRCSGSDLALSSMTIQENTDGSATMNVQISESDNAPTFQFNVQYGFKDLKSGTSATLIAQKPGGSQVGGTFTNAALLRVLEGQRNAILSMNGTVYRVRCF